MYNIEIEKVEDSATFYLNRPNNLVKIIILICASLIVALFCISYFCVIDIKVTENGIMQASSRNEFVVNQVGGIITKCYVKDGERVQKNQELFELDSDLVSIELEKFNEKLNKMEQLKKINQKYYKWLDNINDKPKFRKDNFYYSEYIQKYDYINDILIHNNEVKNNQEGIITDKIQKCEKKISDSEMERKTNLVSTVPRCFYRTM